MKDIDFYTEAHLVVAAVRIIEYRDNAPPSIDEVCKILSFSSEHGHLICRRLEDMGIINVVEGAYGTRLSIHNHLLIEEIPKGAKESGFEEELKKFQDERKELSKKIESIQAKQAKKKKDLFAEIDKQLKEDLGKNGKK